MVAKNDPKSFYLTRVYDSPVQAVWDAWTDPEQVAKWWGPRGFTLTTHSKDLRVGGNWNYTMHGPDGVDYPNNTVYYEVEPCKKLVYDHGGYADRPPLFRVTALFSEVAGKTKLELKFTFLSAEEAVSMRKFIKEVGGNSTWDRLAEYLAETQDGRNALVVNRTIQAPLDQVFEMWTDQANFVQWHAPVGFEMDFLRADIRSGGSCFFRMSNDSGINFYGQLEYLEINPPNRIVYVQRFCNEKEQIGRHPGLPVFPEALFIQVNFTHESDRETRITVTSEPMGHATAEEVVGFLSLRSSMSKGWSGSFDKLDSLVAHDSARQA